MPEYATYRLLITVLTPLHIGSGQELLNEYDYRIYNRQTWRINEAALLEDQDIDDPAIAERLAQTAPGQLLREPDDFDPQSKYFRYVIKGMPRSQASGAQLREQIKDKFDRPYLPGSSLKGALRTALGWYGWEKLKLKPDAGKLGRTAKFAAQDYEHEIFASTAPRPGKEPNYDLLKTLQISDSQALDPGCLFLVNASVINRIGETGQNIPVEVEALRPETNFEATLKIDLALFSDWARQHGLRLAGEEWLKALPEICRRYAGERIQQEINWYRKIPAANRLLSAYQQLGQAHLGGNQFLLQLGWGTGWDGKTYGARLKADPAFMKEIINRYRMARGNRLPDDPFPKSRRAAMIVTTSPQGQRSNIPAVPLGWVLVTLEPLHGATGWLNVTQPAAPLLGVEKPAEPGPEPRPVPQATSQHPEVQAPPKVSALPPERKPETSSFKAPPAIGDRFRGEVFEVSGNAVLLSIPGLDDTVAYAIISLGEFSRKPREGEIVLCEVIGKEQEPNKTWKIRCKRD